MSKQHKAGTTRLLTYKQLGEKLGYSVSTLRNKMSNGKLPFTPIKLNDHTVRFRESEIEDWIEERASASQAS